MAAAVLSRPARARTPRGQIEVTVADGQPTFFDADALEAMDVVEIETKTPWYPGRIRFSGPPMRKLLDAVGGTGRDVRVTALNDYSALVSAAALADGRAILATRRDGERMTVPERGPAWLVFPYDVYPESQRPALFPLSVWQVARIQVV